MSMNRKSIVSAATLLLLASLAPFGNTTAAVEIRGSGAGGALIVPLWSIGVGASFADGAADTLLTLTNHANQPTAVKVRIIGQSGSETAAFNLYLDGWDSFAAALFADSDAGGQGTLITRDESCLVPEFEADDESDLRRLPLAGTDVGGYIEVVEMGRADPESGLTRPSESPSNLPIRWLDCETLRSRFGNEWQVDPAAGLLPPAEQLSARLQLIAVGTGANAAFDAVAISGFSDIVQHSPPDATTPNLATAHTADTDSGVTVSRLCQPEGCREYEWDRPIDAVASVLTADSLRGDVNIKPSIGADSEMILISPLARYSAEYPPAATAEASIVPRDREGQAIDPVVIPVFPATSPAPHPWVLPAIGVDQTVQLFSFAEMSADPAFPQISRLVGIGVAAGVTLEDGFSARVEIGFLQGLEQQLVSRDGYRFPGLPVIGLIVRQFTNGTLTDADAPGPRVLGNYRGPERMTSTRQIWPVQP